MSYPELGVCLFNRKSCFFFFKLFCEIKFDTLRHLFFSEYRRLPFSFPFLLRKSYHDFVPFRIEISSVKQKQSQNEGSSGVIGTADDIKSLKVRIVNCLWVGLESP